MTSGYYLTLTEWPDPEARDAPRPLRDVLFRFAADATARCQALMTATGVLASHRDWLGRMRYDLLRPDLVVSARLPARNAVIGEYSALGITLCTLVRALGLHDALLLIDRSQLEPALSRIERLMREEASEPLNMIPLIATALRSVIEERVVGVLG